MARTAQPQKGFSPRTRGSRIKGWEGAGASPANGLLRAEPRGKVRVLERTVTPRCSDKSARDAAPLRRHLKAAKTVRGCYPSEKQAT